MSMSMLAPTSPARSVSDAQPCAEVAFAAERSGRLPSLDGLRGVSILMVVAAHCQGTVGFPSVLTSDICGDLGAFGVRVFFVISGFLITSLLLKEFERNGRIDLPRFYARRSVRIFPACYLYIGTMGALFWLGLISPNAIDFLFAATYTMNHWPAHDWVMGHLWSLAVEEQFYLLWPFALAYAGRRRGMWIAAAAVGLAPIVRVVMMQGFGIYEGVGRIFPTVADGLAAGCLLAGLRPLLEGHDRYVKMVRARWFYLLPISALLLNAAIWRRPTLMGAFGATALNVLIAVSLHRWVLLPGDLFGKLLNGRVLSAIGVLSYSLYLWQQVFLNRGSTSWFNAFPWNVVLALMTAWVSYTLVERPLAGLRIRLQARAEAPGERSMIAGRKGSERRSRRGPEPVCRTSSNVPESAGGT